MKQDDFAAVASARLGRTLRGKWRLESLLGVGGTSAVYAASHVNGAPVAIKILHPGHGVCPEVRARFFREGHLANRVRHPAIVGVLDQDVDEVDGAAFLVMERVDGECLDDRARRTLFGDDELLDVAAQVLAALVAAHAAGVVHRDLKPENLLVDGDGTIRILDFGIARAMAPEGDAAATVIGAICGTPGYLAPEQARGDRDAISPRTDLFNLGATLFALAARRPPIEGPTLQVELLRAACEQAPPLGSVAAQVSDDVCAIVDRATAFAPEDRWPSAAEMLAEVLRARRLRGRRQRTLSTRNATPSLAPEPARSGVDSCGAIATPSAIAKDAVTLPGTPSAKRALRKVVITVMLAAPLLLVALAARVELRWRPHATTAAAAAQVQVATAAPEAASAKAPEPILVTVSADPPTSARAPSATPSSAAKAATAPSARAAASPSAAATPSVVQRTVAAREDDPVPVLPGYRESPY